MLRKRIVEIYVDGNGKRPYVKWLDNLKDKNVAERIDFRIKRFEIDGYVGLIEPVVRVFLKLNIILGEGLECILGMTMKI